MRAEQYWEQRWRDEEARNARLVAALEAAKDRNANLVMVVEDAINTLEETHMHIDNPVYERLSRALQQSTEKP